MELFFTISGTNHPVFQKTAHREGVHLLTEAVFIQDAAKVALDLRITQTATSFSEMGFEASSNRIGALTGFL